MISGPDYVEVIRALRKEINSDVAALLDPAKQKRQFPKKGLEKFLKKKKVKTSPRESPG